MAAAYRDGFSDTVEAHNNMRIADELKFDMRHVLNSVTLSPYCL
jgi:hypothetical protein